MDGEEMLEEFLSAGTENITDDDLEKAKQEIDEKIDENFEAKEVIEKIQESRKLAFFEINYDESSDIYSMNSDTFKALLGRSGIM